jgi:mono/diheme cytochrome c family protein
MNSRTLFRGIPVALAVLLLGGGCSRKEPEPASPPATAAPEAAPAATSAPVGATAAAPAAATTAAADSDAGAQAYKTYCVTCHGATGKGDGAAAAALNPKPANFAIGAFKYDANGNGATGDIDDIKAIVHDGAAKHGGSPLMAPWPMLSPDQLQAIAEHVKSLHTG